MGATTIRSSNTSGVLELTGDSDLTISDLTVESTATGTSSIGIAANYNGLQSRFTITNCRITGTTNTAVRFPYAIHDLTFTDNLIEDCVAGFTGHAGQGNLSRNLTFAVTVLAVAGTIFGTFLSHRIAAVKLQKGFAMFVLAVAFFLIIKNYGVLIGS